MDRNNMKKVEPFFDNCVIFVEKDNENYTLDDFQKGITELHQFLISISCESDPNT